jgi:molecular chaperone GrpE
MTKSPDRGEMDPIIESAAAGDPESQGDQDDPGELRENAPRDAPAGGEDDDLALDVEVEPPEATLEQRLAELEAKQKETFDRYLRSVAELENFRKRTRKEIEDARIDAQSRVLREMLPVIDNLERAMVAAGGAEAESGHSIIEGVRLVLRQFAQALERCGVTQVAAQGMAFDPTHHEAVSQVETDESPPGTVVGVLQSGYRIGERLLRPALVVVAKALPQAVPPDGGDEGDGADGDGSDGDGGDGGVGNGHARDGDGGAGAAGHDDRDPEAA